MAKMGSPKPKPAPVPPSAVFTCQYCQRVYATEELRPTGKRGSMQKTLVPALGATITKNSKDAPRIRCVCGELFIHLKGTMS